MMTRLQKEKNGKELDQRNRKEVMMADVFLRVFESRLATAGKQRYILPGCILGSPQLTEIPCGSTPLWIRRNP
jgi:hypothetical protein